MTDNPNHVSKTAILDLLAAERIFSIYRYAQHFVLEERCDGNFSVILTPCEMRQLSGEIYALSLEENPDG